jgi:uncharacterized repeat protein (TIGR01451 family)
MKMLRLKRPALPHAVAVTAMVVAATGVLLPSWAVADTAANAVIRNSVTVSFADAANTTQTPVTDAVDVTVNLVPAAAVIAQVTSDAIIAPGGDVTYTYTITSGANGPDAYDIDRIITADNMSTLTDLSTVTPATQNVPLGATSVAAAASIPDTNTVSVFVPVDQSGSLLEINGLEVGDIVAVNGGATELTVAGIVDNDVVPGSGAIPLAEITLTNNTGGTVNLAVGDLLQERAEFTLLATPEDYQGPGNKTLVHTVEATDGSNVSNTLTTTTTVTGLDVTVSKTVRNVFNAAGNASGVGATPLIGGAVYYTGGVSADPGDTLEYLINVYNAAGASTATDVVITDAIPEFTSFVAGSIQMDPGTGTFGGQSDAVDSDEGEEDAGTVTIYAGSGGDGATDTGGSLPANTNTYGRFRVLVE